MVVISCARQPQYSITVENIPEDAANASLYIYDSIYNACREINRQQCDDNKKSLKFFGNISKPELAYLTFANDTSRYFFVVDTVPTTLRMPISGNCMNIVEGSEENMVIEKTYRQIRSLIFQHNSTFSEYALRKNDSTFSVLDEKKVESELFDIDKEVQLLIEEANSSLNNPYKYLNKLRYNTIERQLEEPSN
ncbi:MAG: hypothetical protein K2J74_04855 [Muribaculaceae bacterium]|nr:hypothetical protein [Muribaculaceae bacterium]